MRPELTGALVSPVFDQLALPGLWYMWNGGREVNSRCNSTAQWVHKLFGIHSFKLVSHTNWSLLQVSSGRNGLVGIWVHILMPKLMFSETTSFFLVGIPSSPRIPLTYYPREMTYNWELIWSISYKQKGARWSHDPTTETRGLSGKQWGNLPQNRGWTEIGKVEVLSWPLCKKKDNASLLLPLLEPQWGSVYNEHIPCLVQVHCWHTAHLDLGKF